MFRSRTPGLAKVLPLDVESDDMICELQLSWAAARTSCHHFPPLSPCANLHQPASACMSVQNMNPALVKVVGTSLPRVKKTSSRGMHGYAGYAVCRRKCEKVIWGERRWQNHGLRTNRIFLQGRSNCAVEAVWVTRVSWCVCAWLRCGCSYLNCMLCCHRLSQDAVSDFLGFSDSWDLRATTGWGTVSQEEHVKARQVSKTQSLLGRMTSYDFTWPHTSSALYSLTIL